MPYERKLRPTKKAVLFAEPEAGDAIDVTYSKCRHWSLIAPHVLLARAHASVARWARRPER